MKGFHVYAKVCGVCSTCAYLYGHRPRKIVFFHEIYVLYTMCIDKKGKLPNSRSGRFADRPLLLHNTLFTLFTMYVLNFFETKFTQLMLEVLQLLMICFVIC